MMHLNMFHDTQTPLYMQCALQLVPRMKFSFAAALQELIFVSKQAIFKPPKAIRSVFTCSDILTAGSNAC